ncbi:hypothetical protein ACQR1Y_12005 [Bradyrhizobium sp. HKCCYLRH3099]|uniref:hypothetical protein n=1 Tax=unclassified Bradyrhizobium TaxID=2631580 RepID=UPI003EBB4727
MTEPNKAGDLRIIEELEIIRRRNRNGDNPNLCRPRMIFDFETSKVCLEQAA